MTLAWPAWAAHGDPKSTMVPSATYGIDPAHQQGPTPTLDEAFVIGA
jgi:hypothetical protein